MTQPQAPDKTDTGGFTPLTTAAFHILLVLSHGSRHGYGIKQEAEKLTRGAVRLGPGTLYESIQRLERDALIAEDVDAQKDHPQRRYYGLTALGREVLDAELDRIGQALEYARGVGRREISRRSEPA